MKTLGWVLRYGWFLGLVMAHGMAVQGEGSQGTAAIRLHPDARGVLVRHVSASADGGLLIAGTLHLPEDRARYVVVRLNPNRGVVWTWSFIPPAALKAEVMDATPDGEGGVYVTGTGGTLRLNGEGQVRWYQRWPGICLAADTAGRLRVGGALEETFSWGLFEADGTPVHFDQWRAITGNTPYVAWGKVAIGTLVKGGMYYLWGWHDGGFASGMGSWYLGHAGIGEDGRLVFGHRNPGSMPYPLYYGPDHFNWRLIGAVAHPEEGAWMLGRLYLGDGTRGAWLVRSRDNRSNWHEVESSSDENWRFHQLATGTGGEVWVVGRTPGFNILNPDLAPNSLYVARYSEDGSPVWKRTYPMESEARQEGQDMVVMGETHAYVIGSETENQNSRAFVLELSAGAGAVERRLVHSTELGSPSTGQKVLGNADGGCWVVGEIKDATGMADLLVWRISPR